ncbi:viral a-type inclusion repeat protein [Ichthyophthirius multifiliis]|uniref:Viral a-type inclusion repeat protein n=1 Tax=Ichthyophthirius multifiliis TaxID=5932 RepID=G0QRP8_ICHMU|nr:viral a-type inclusion repeat protein [Ichthyophthirius multifiliis]EGR32108.1 viral a-type inclusion repeat protein [Ichthyophthirius multifiliis]|eukprot:XP_004035594.1 viral a-type inclusion repeat protein [Ichthyophthirius multifiliis]
MIIIIELNKYNTLPISLEKKYHQKDLSEPNNLKKILPYYQGNKKNQLREGIGCQVYENGNVYEGEWKNDNRNGYGILKDNFGIDIYNGDWKNDMYNGKGRLRNLNVQICFNEECDDFEKIFKQWQFYSGQFINNLMHGQGTLIIYGNYKFIGTFVQGKIKGEGCLFKDNLQFVKGIWDNYDIQGNYEN